MMKRIARRLIAALVVCIALSAHLAAQTQMQFPTTPWGGYAPASIQCGELLTANFNSVLDQVIQLSLPSGTWMVESITVSNPSVSLTTAAGGIYSGASKTGVAVVGSGQAYSTLTTNAANTTGNALLLTISTAGLTTAFNGYQQPNQLSQLLVSLTTPQGAAATADIRVKCRPLFS